LFDLGEVSKQTCGQVYYYPHFNGSRDGERLYADLKHNITRRIGFEAVMRVRCSVGMKIKENLFVFILNQTKSKSTQNSNVKTIQSNLLHSKGLSVESYHGHYHTSTQTDIDLASVDSDKTFLVNLQYDDSLDEKSDVLFQCALLYPHKH
jgi:protein transport protein SEC24